jgi:NADPH:quinone reductase-like Zn-dependent oxidoreductase
MRAVICRAYGEPESLEVGELPKPAMKEDGVRIRVRAVGLNFPDILSVQGRYQWKYPFPFAPGMECAGEVIEVGPKVTHVRVGDRVAAHPWTGCYAEEVVAPESVTYPMPDAMSYEQGAAFTIGYGTVHHGLFDRGELKRGESLLVLGAAGGVGLNAVEVGKLAGARVLAAASTADKLALCRDYGADELINYKDEPLKDRVRALTADAGADVTFDPVGGEMTEAALRSTSWRGRVVIIGFASGTIPKVPTNFALLRGAAVVGSAYHTFCNREPERARANMQELMGWCAEGKLNPHISFKFPLERYLDGLLALRERRATGKVILTVD